MKKGLFITFEGGEGSGKSTQAKLLYQYFLQKNIPVHLTREPGGTALAEKLRTIMLQSPGVKDPLTEMLIISAARRDHVEQFIKPKLEEGEIVISDRFFDSSYVYQGYVKQLDLDMLKQINALAIGNFEPDCTFLLDIDPQYALKRISSDEREVNHYDQQSLDFHHAIRNGFLEVAKTFKHRVQMIDAREKVEAINEKIISIVNIAYMKI